MAIIMREGLHHLRRAWFGTVECELLDRTRFCSHVKVRIAIFEFIEGWYNPRRRHSAVGYLSPINYEGNQLLPLAQVRNRPRNRGNSTGRTSL